MKWKPFAYGIGIGIAVALPLSLATTAALKILPDANLVNFGPAIFGFGIFALEILAAAVALLAGSVCLLRRRWKKAGFAMAFAITVVGWWAKTLLY